MVIVTTTQLYKPHFGRFQKEMVKKSEGHQLHEAVFELSFLNDSLFIAFLKEQKFKFINGQISKGNTVLAVCAGCTCKKFFPYKSFQKTNKERSQEKTKLKGLLK